MVAMEQLVGESEQALLLELLNSTPVVNGESTDLLAGEEQAREWIQRRGGTGSPAEADELRRTRDRLQAVVRDTARPSALAAVVSEIRLVPSVTDEGLAWTLDVPQERRLAALAILAWARLREKMPGRLRACANDECQMFLIDRSRANAARWCSMKVCGNRMKARRHYRRGLQPKEATAETGSSTLSER
jgi:predicted RNA-binding Zn ribbon-like protein